MMVREMPLDKEKVGQILDRFDINLRTASIREMNRVVNEIERELEIRFIRMEFGIPGLPTNPLAVEAEIEAISSRGLSNRYAPFDGIPELKEEAARFARNFMNLEIPSSSCVPTVGAMQGGFLAQAVAGRITPERDTILFLEPSFPVNRQQTMFLGLKEDRIDFYDYRGNDLIRALDDRLAKGDVAAVIWSSPNNPTWIILSDEELQGMGEVMDRHQTVAIEDLAYFGMDFRNDCGTPGEPPYQNTIARYMKRYFTIVSSSKMFSYAGQRIAITYIAPDLMEEKSIHLEQYFGTQKVGYAFVHGGIYPTTASVPEGPQHGLLALMKAANNGDFRFTDSLSEYARRAKVMKRLFRENGFQIVYDTDLGEPLADGFYFTFAYPGIGEGHELVRRLLHYGISAITLDSAGSVRTEALRGCVSLVSEDQFDDLESRLKRFHEDYPLPADRRPTNRSVGIE